MRPVYSFLTDLHCTETMFKRYIRWTNKMRKFGAYMEVEEISPNRDYPNQVWSVKLFCPKIHVDRLGNMAIMKGQ